MDKGQSKESDFTGDIDRIVSGRAPEADRASDSEYRADLDFASKVAETRRRPSPEFQANLKTRLLSRLDEMEGAKETARRPSFSEWLTGLFRQRAWQVAGVTTAVLVIAMVVVWRIGLFSRTPTITTPPPVVAVEAKVVLDNESYLVGEVVKIDFSFSNVSSQTVSFMLPPAFRIETPAAVTVLSYPAGDVSVTLTPGVSTSYSVTWDQTDTAGLQVPPGEYQIVLPNVSLGDAGYLSLPQSPLIVILGQ